MTPPSSRPADPQSVADFEILRKLSPDAMRTELSGLLCHELTRGDEIEPDDRISAILVVRGRLALDVRGGARDRRTIGVTEEGEVLFTRRPAWAEAPDTILRALVRCEIIPVDVERFERWLAMPECSRAMFAALNTQLAHRELALSIALEPTVEQRLLLKLRQLGQRWGTMTPEGVRLDLRLTHQELADMVGAARESVTLAMGRLSESGEIEVDEQRVLLRNA